MTDYPEIEAFVVDWFQRFDRLDPADAFLPNLHQEVVWDMPDVDESLHGHERFKAWYRGILETFERPTEHDLSEIAVTDKVITLKVDLRARLKDGSKLELTARENWQYELSSEGQPLLTHYSVEL